jgi:hypothetical protein
MTSALRHPEPWAGRCSVIDWFAESQISHPGLMRVMLDPRGDAPYARARQEHGAALDGLIAGARARGRCPAGCDHR